MNPILKSAYVWSSIVLTCANFVHAAERSAAERFTTERESTHTVERFNRPLELILRQEFYDTENRDVDWGGHLSRLSERHRITITTGSAGDGRREEKEVLVRDDTAYTIFDWYTICHIHVESDRLYLVRFSQQMSGAGVSVRVYDLAGEVAEVPDYDSYWFPRIGSRDSARLLDVIGASLTRWQTNVKLRDGRLECRIDTDHGGATFSFDTERLEWSITNPEFEITPDPRRPEPWIKPTDADRPAN